jgi:hypothetical protein
MNAFARRSMKSTKLQSSKDPLAKSAKQGKQHGCMSDVRVGVDNPRFLLAVKTLVTLCLLCTPLIRVVHAWVLFFYLGAYDRGKDIFGNDKFTPMNENYPCDNCKKSFPGSRFAPHLEKCLGMGRSSSRVASRK